MKIPCDTIARLSHVLGAAAPFDCFRLDNGKVIATNREFMAIEAVAPFDGVFYIRGDAAMIEQCRTEAHYSSVIDFTPVEMLRYTTAITSHGFKISENIGYWPETSTDFDRWSDIVAACREPLTDSAGPLVVDAAGLSALAEASPSGRVVMEQYFAPEQRSSIVRDADTADWVGFFLARFNDGIARNAATVPGWCK